MQARLIAAAALAIFNLAAAATPALAAGPDYNYLQNELDGRGRCLGTSGDKVAMTACDKSAAQQWVVGQGDIPGFSKLHTMAGGAAACLTVHPGAPKNVLSWDSCGKADNQQWYVERLPAGGRLSRLTNRETGATRCLEAV